MESALCPPTEPDFRLIETLRFDPTEGFIRQERHLARMQRSAMALDISFDLGQAIATLEAARGDQALRCRLTLDASGGFALTTGALSRNPSRWRVAVAPQRLDAADPWLHHKTTRRALYDNARADLPEELDEWLFLNAGDELCEGTITNVFVETGDGRHLTPPLSSGLLPGILREELLADGKVTEAPISLTLLQNARSVHVGNSLRGLIKAELTAV